MYFDNHPILRDFQYFIDFLAARPTLPLTNDKGVLKSPDLLQLNEKMQSFQTQFVTNKSQQMTYTLLSTFFHIVTANGFFGVKNQTKGDKKVLNINEKRVNQYENLNDDEKYFFLLESFWTVIDWEAAFDCRAFWGTDFYKTLIKKGINISVTVSDSESKRDGELNGYTDLFFAEICDAFGLIALNWDANFTARPSRYSFPYNNVMLTPLGNEIIPILFYKRPQHVWGGFNRCLLEFFTADEDFEYDDEDKEVVEQNFEDAFKESFPSLKIENRIIAFKHELIKGNYTFKISLAKDLYRTVTIAGSDTFECFHDVIQDLFDFENDHLYAFFMDGKRWSQSAMTFWAPENDEGVRSFMVKIGEVGLYEGKSFLYLFDFGAEWKLNVEVIKIQENDSEPKEYILIESVGESPQQYGSWNDDDDD